MFPNSGKPSLAPLLTRLLGNVVAFERQAHEKLRPTQLRPPSGGRIEGDGEVVGFGHKMTRTSRRHPSSVALVTAGATRVPFRLAQFVRKDGEGTQEAVGLPSRDPSVRCGPDPAPGLCTALDLGRDQPFECPAAGPVRFARAQRRSRCGRCDEPQFPRNGRRRSKCSTGWSLL